MWKLLLPRTWQKKISGTSKGARFTFECCRHSYSYSNSNKKRCTSECNKKNPYVHATCESDCCWLAGWCHLGCGRLNPKKVGMHREILGIQRTPTGSRKKSNVVFSHPVPRELTARGWILSSMRRFLWITNGWRQANIPNDRPGQKSAPALSKWPRAEMIGNS